MNTRLYGLPSALAWALALASCASDQGNQQPEPQTAGNAGSGGSTGTSSSSSSGGAGGSSSVTTSSSPTSSTTAGGSRGGTETGGIVGTVDPGTTTSGAQAGSGGASDGSSGGSGGGAGAIDANDAAPGVGGAGGTTTPGQGGASGSGGSTGSNVIAETPPMGWNSWNKFACKISDSEVRGIADAMVSSGMKDVGYQYVNIDDCWQDHRDAAGTIVPGTNFPDMKGLADYVHGKGLKLGLYSDRGAKTCGGRPGAQGYEAQDAKTYAAWGIDYLKYDNCNASASTMQAGYTTMANALKATGRPIVFSICAWEFQTWMPTVGQLWRTTLDIKANWASIMSMMDQNSQWAQYAGPGHWNDPDMLEVGNGSLTDAQNRAHFGMWAMLAAPLISGNDLRSMSPAVKSILTAPEVIAIDQDRLGVQGTLVKGKGTLEVWKKKLSGINTVAVGLLNRTGNAADISITWTEAGLPSGAATVRDVYAKSDIGSFIGTYTAKSVPSNGLALVKIASQ